MDQGAFAFLKALSLSVAAVIVTSAPSFAQSATMGGTNSKTASGLTAGAHAGYNWQNGPAVYGFEADFSAADLKLSMSGGLSCLILSCLPDGSPFAFASSKLDWYGTLRGRFGFASGPILVYGTGGFAYGKVDLASSFGGVSEVSVSAQASRVKTGWVAGGGIELMLQPNVALNLGYQYIDLGSIDLASIALSRNDRPTTQTASAHAQFQTVTLGLSWKFAPSGTAGALKSWEGGYLGGQVAGGWGLDTIANYLGIFVSCFTAETQVLMADGTSRPIATVKIGDEVLGEDGAVNRVVAIQNRVLGSRKLYAFNGGPAFVTPEHPFMTRAGWKSMAPEATLRETKMSVATLTVQDELVSLDTVTARPKALSVALGGAEQPSSEVVIATKFVPLESATPHDRDPFTPVYNLRLDGNHSYFANGFLTHNR